MKTPQTPRHQNHSSSRPKNARRILDTHDEILVASVTAVQHAMVASSQDWHPYFERIRSSREITPEATNWAPQESSVDFIECTVLWFESAVMISMEEHIFSWLQPRLQHRTSEPMATQCLPGPVGGTRNLEQACLSLHSSQHATFRWEKKILRIEKLMYPGPKVDLCLKSLSASNSLWRISRPSKELKLQRCASANRNPAYTQIKIAPVNPVSTMGHDDINEGSCCHAMCKPWTPAWVAIHRTDLIVTWQPAEYSVIFPNDSVINTSA